ncbi:MAG: AAA family ATPase [Oscillospiraceae bacterium]|nr:AAA family ATPase [Oscillospiraceae bacterium]
MGIAVLILGASGSGKSTSLRNFKTGEVSIFNVASKPLPFKGSGKLATINQPTYDQIRAGLKGAKAKSLVIDDSQYLMVFEEFDRAKEAGYGKFTDIAQNFYKLVQAAIKETGADTIVYFLHHTDVDETGRIKAKTVGKMIDSHLTLEGLFPIVLLAGTDGTSYWFDTQSDGYTTAKSPMGMFEKRIENDLKVVDSTIREYWGLEKNNAKKESEGK